MSSSVDLCIWWLYLGNIQICFKEDKCDFVTRIRLRISRLTKIFGQNKSATNKCSSNELFENFHLFPPGVNPVETLGTLAISLQSTPCGAFVYAITFHARTLTHVCGILGVWRENSPSRLMNCLDTVACRIYCTLLTTCCLFPFILLALTGRRCFGRTCRIWTTITEDC